MKTIIVTVTGQPRTGKDTLIEMTRAALLADLLTEHILVVSSIDSTKSFLQRVATEELGLRPDYIETSVLDERRRQGLSMIKQGLDIALDYTAVLPFGLATQRSYPRVLFYQVRELHNVHRIRQATEAVGIACHHAVFVHAEDRPESGMADSDSPDPAGFKWDSFIENDYGLGLNDQAKELASVILRKFYGELTPQ